MKTYKITIILYQTAKSKETIWREMENDLSNEDLLTHIIDNTEEIEEV